MSQLGKLLGERRVLVCVGPGGVGKTTCSAAMGLRAAMDGKKVLVLTIDPARRLANSLGISAIGNTETRITDASFRSARLSPKGQLWAMTLDMKLVWDDLVRRHAPSEKRRDQILGNRLYRQLSTKLAGSLEYMAMEKLFELAQSRDYDLLVLDTPPTVHALDFLEAPNRLLDVLDNDAARWLLTPALAAGEIGLKFGSLGASYVARTLAKFTGAQLLQELAQFLVAFRGMYEGFKERATLVKALLESEQTGFVLVTSPQTLAVDEAIFFARALREEQIPMQAAIMNRVYPQQTGAPSVATLRAAGVEETLAQTLAQTAQDYALLARADHAAQLRLASVLGPEIPLHSIPRFVRDVHDLRGLWEVNEHLFGDSA